MTTTTGVGVAPGRHTITRSTSSIWVTFSKVGFHCYPDAPEQVAYLRSRHRHIFNFKVTMPVTHANREVEFHMLKTHCESFYADNALEVDGKSCEMLAKELADKLVVFYARDVTVEVNEDGECGAIVTVALVDS